MSDTMIAWMALALASLAVGLGIVALFADAWRDELRAEMHRQSLDETWSHGWRAGREQSKRDAR